MMRWLLYLRQRADVPGYLLPTLAARSRWRCAQVLLQASRLSEYSMHGVEQSSFLLQQERKSETPGTVCKFRDLGWQYLCHGALVPTPTDGRGSDQGDR